MIRPFKNLVIKKGTYLENFTSFVTIPNLFNTDEVNKIRQLWDAEQSITAEIKYGAGTITDNNVRQSKISFIEPENNEWIYDRIAMACIITNANRFKFDISDFHSKLKIANYEPGDFFDWHMDLGSHTISTRKLSFSIQLSDAEEYEGGELQFLKATNFKTASKEKGAFIIFPSFIVHRVQPVTTGCRKSIVGHIAGAPFI